MLVFRKKFPFDGSDDEVIMADNSRPAGIAIDMENDQNHNIDSVSNQSVLLFDVCCRSKILMKSFQ
jgi:hypothetical protein